MWKRFGMHTHTQVNLEAVPLQGQNSDPPLPRTPSKSGVSHLIIPTSPHLKELYEHSQLIVQHVFRLWSQWWYVIAIILHDYIDQVTA